MQGNTSFGLEAKSSFTSVAQQILLNRSESKNKSHFSAQAYCDEMHNSVDKTLSTRIRKNSAFRSGVTEVDAAKHNQMSSSIS